MFWKTRSKLFWSLIGAIIAGLLITFAYFYFSETQYTRQDANSGATDSTTFQKSPADEANTRGRK